MENRKVEVILLKKIKALFENMNIYPSTDLKHTRELKLPRVVSKTISNEVIAVHTKRVENGYNQIETHEHTIQLTFALDNNLDYQSVNYIRSYFTHIQGTRYWNAIEKLGIVIQKVGSIIDISDHTKDGYIERYALDITVTTLNEMMSDIKTIDKVIYTQNGEIIETGGKE